MVFPRYRIVNPLLGVYYGIFTSAYIGSFFLLLIFEYTGTIDLQLINYGLAAAALLLTASIAIAATTQQSEEFYASGRRVPAGLNGLAMFAGALGGAGLLGMTGSIFFLGFDAFCLLLGFVVGFVVAAILFAPFLRKCGAYSIGGFFELRFNSRSIGAGIGLILLPPVFMIAMANLNLLQQLLSHNFGLGAIETVILSLVIVLVLIVPGGIRSLTWSQCGWSIIILAGILLPSILIALKFTHLPFPQLTYGSLINDVNGFETLQKLHNGEGQQNASLLPMMAPQTVTSWFFVPFSALSRFEFFTLFLTLAFGIAACPMILVRASLTSNVYQSRKSFAWGTAIAAIMAISLPAIALFFRYIIFDPKNTITLGALGGWAQQMFNDGMILFADKNGDQQITGNELAIARDAVFTALAKVSDLSFSVQAFTLLAAIAACFAALSAALLSLGGIFLHDLNPNKKQFEARFNQGGHLMWVRGSLVVLALMVGLMTLQFNFDPFRFYLFALVLFGCSLFPVLMMSIWWSGLTRTGVWAGMITGFLISFLYIILTEWGGMAPLFAIPNLMIGLIAIPFNFLVAVSISLMGSSRGAKEMEALEDIRLPGGETIYDRVLRLAMPRRPRTGV